MKIPGIDAVFVVGVSGSPRLANIGRQLEIMGLDFELFDAFDAARLSLETPVCSSLLEGAPLPVGRLGNYLSQVAIFREAARRRLGNVLILEEDCRLCWQFLHLAENAVAALPPDWHLLNFGALDWNKPAAKGVNATLYKPGRPMMRHAVLHRAEALPLLIELTRTLAETLDVQLCNLAVAGTLNVYATHANIAFQDNNPAPNPAP